MNAQQHIRTFGEIAQEIRALWKNPYFGAVPYIEAMNHLRTNDPNEPYLFEDARTIILYFLSNASTWRGDDAKRIKAELKQMLK